MQMINTEINYEIYNTEIRHNYMSMLFINISKKTKEKLEQ